MTILINMAGDGQAYFASSTQVLTNSALNQIMDPGCGSTTSWLSVMEARYTTLDSIPRLSHRMQLSESISMQLTPGFMSVGCTCSTQEVGLGVLCNTTAQTHPMCRPYYTHSPHCQDNVNYCS